jgi:hypothetical protein
VQPGAVEQQQRINKLVQQRAASDNALPPSDVEVVMANMQYSDMKRNTDAEYAKRTQKQAMQAVQAQAPARAQVGGPEKRYVASSIATAKCSEATAAGRQCMAQMAASDQKQEPTEMDKVLAMRHYADLSKQTKKAYAERLRSQLALSDKHEI